MLQYITITIIGVGELVQHWLLYANFHKITYSRRSSDSKGMYGISIPSCKGFFQQHTNQFTNFRTHLSIKEYQWNKEGNFGK